MSELQLPGFELIEKIGEGGMGHVWKARQLSLDRIVAIKLLPPRFSHDPESVRQIIQEARIAAKLKHQGLVQVYDANAQNDSFYFVMEYVDGYNIGHWVARKKCLQSKDALIVVEAVANALHYAWQTSELIHCDIKLENIMVDQDGTIKVADLGLSLTRDSQSLLHADEVAGTPGYISPEQVLGGIKLDCRTDIYSLGCCLYHMVTGRRPFSELSDSEVMQAQVTSFIPDPREVIPSVPAPVCALIERMLVKNRDHRLKDWHSVVSEVRRVQHGLAPAGPPPEENASTLRRRPNPAIPVKELLGAVQDKKPSVRKVPWEGLFLLAVVVAVGLWFKSNKSPVAQDVVIPQFQQVTNPIGPKVAPSSRTRPAQGVVPVASSNAGLNEALSEIRRVTDDFSAEGSFTNAIVWLENYYGHWADATATNRAALIAELRQNMMEVESARRGQEAWSLLMKDIAGTILTGKYAAARQTIESACHDAKYADHRSDLTSIGEVLAGVGALNDRLLETFSKDIGKVTSIPLNRGEFVGRVIEIRDRKVICKTVDETAQAEIKLEDIATGERLRRLTSLELPEVYLVRGVNALNEGSIDEGLALLSKTGPVLGPILTQGIQAGSDAGRKAVMTADDALMAFCGLMKKAGMEPGIFDGQQWLNSIGALRLSAAEGLVVEKGLDDFLVTYGGSKFSENNAALILSLRKACGNAQESSRLEAAPAAIPSEVDSPLGRIAYAMIAKNEGLDLGAVSLDPSSTQDKLAIRIVSSAVHDLGPLSEFKTISSLTLESPEKRTIFLDIAPLANLPLKQLSLIGYDLSDVSKLRGMRLSKLQVPHVTLKNLSVLQGMPLTVLDITGTQVDSLTPLQGMRIEVLRADDTKVASIMPLAGMPLRELSLHGTMVRDVAYLQGVPLESLNLSGTPVTDFFVLRSFKLARLDVSDTSLKDLTFCTDMPLIDLDIGGISVPSLAPLSGKTFRRLVLGNAGIKDASALKSIKVSCLDLSGSKLSQTVLSTLLAQLQPEELNLSDTTLERLDFLKNNKSLKTLDLSNVKVADWSPLSGLTIEVLSIRGVPVGDIAVLRTLQSLRVLNTDIEDPRLLYIIKSVPTLTRINGKTVEAVVRALRPRLMPNRVGQ